MLDLNKAGQQDWEVMEATELRSAKKPFVTQSVREVNSEAASQTTAEPFDRGIGKVRWILTCIGLYVGALLYGTYIQYHIKM